jgi:hypothetical protein
VPLVLLLQLRRKVISQTLQRLLLSASCRAVWVLR